MRQAHRLKLSILSLVLAFAMFSFGCSGEITLADIKNKLGGAELTIKEDESLPLRDATPRIADVSAPGAAAFYGGGAVVDYSNCAAGYVMIAYEGDNPNVKVQITYTGQATYTYNLIPNAGYQAFPLSAGAGDYDIGVYTNLGGDKYAQAARGTINAPIADGFQPFLHPNQFANYNASSACVAQASTIVAEARTDIGATERIYQYIVKNIDYDYDKAATVQSGYTPNPDETLKTGMGICFDYASLMTSMLRSQGIPCRLVVGYAGKAYHAWVSVYSSETGKVLGIIDFTPGDWNRVDPTFTASGDRADPNVVGDGTNYNPIYYY